MNIEISKEDIEMMHAPGVTPTYVCPHCGKPIKLSVKIES